MSNAPSTSVNGIARKKLEKWQEWQVFRMVFCHGTDLLEVTHPDLLKVTHLVFEDGRSGQERQLGFQADFRPFLDFIDSRKR
jgi:hypothetical protein